MPRTHAGRSIAGPLASLVENLCAVVSVAIGNVAPAVPPKDATLGDAESPYARGTGPQRVSVGDEPIRRSSRPIAGVAIPQDAPTVSTDGGDIAGPAGQREVSREKRGAPGQRRQQACEPRGKAATAARRRIAYLGAAHRTHRPDGRSLVGRNSCNGSHFTPIADTAGCLASERVRATLQTRGLQQGVKHSRSYARRRHATGEWLGTGRPRLLFAFYVSPCCRRGPCQHDG